MRRSWTVKMNKTKFLVVARYLYAFEPNNKEVPICVLDTEEQAMMYAGSREVDVKKNENGDVERIISYDYVEIPYCKGYMGE